MNDYPTRAALLALIAVVAVLTLLTRRPMLAPAEPTHPVPDRKPGTRVTGNCHELPETVDALSRMVFLLDVSTSVPLEGFELSLAAVKFGGLRLLKELPAPQHHVVAPISGEAIGGRPLCDLPLPQPTLFRRYCESPEDEYKACIKTLAGARGATRTNIRGALLNAVTWLGGESVQRKGIVVLTDLVEDNQEDDAAVPDLRGVCVAIYFHPTTNDGQHEGGVDARRLAWKKKLESYGATSVMLQPLRSFQAGDLASFFRNCKND